MISVEEALGILLSNLPERKVERIPFQSALGRILAENLVATAISRLFTDLQWMAMPCLLLMSRTRRSNLPLWAKAVQGEACPEQLKPGEAMTIMTGAPVPEGADCVQMVEQSQLSE